MALRRGLIGRNALVHTDQGSQYVSDKYRQAVESARFKAIHERAGELL